MSEPFTIFNNNSIHGCDDCIHKNYCDRKTEASLTQYARVYSWGDNTIPVPATCPILKIPQKEKVVFT